MARININIGNKKNVDRVPWHKIVVKSNSPMDGEQISKEIKYQTGIKTTRQNISNALKSGMESFYNEVCKLDKTQTPFQVATTMMEMLYITGTGNYNDFRGGHESFFRLFPSKLRILIKGDALKLNPGMEYLDERNEY
jgi:hypothetical protein